MIQSQREDAVRPAAVAGLFYPSDPLELHSTVGGLLANAKTEYETGARSGKLYQATHSNASARVAGLDSSLPKALIAPHAGYVYSGPVAASAYHLLAKARGKISRVVLLGPSHRFAFTGMAGTRARAYETPLGLVPIDHSWLERASNAIPLGLSDEVHEGEHCLETQLPFLQLILGDFSLVPIICGRVSGDQVADLLEALWGGPETLIVVSSDLSHYLDHEACQRIDGKTCATIERLDPVSLTPEQACGSAPVKGLVTVARRKGMSIGTLDLRNSGDTAGPRDRVVGYGAWAFWEKEAANDSNDDTVRRHGQLMNDVARRAICGNGGVRGLDKIPPALNRAGACFVTLHKNGDLRGCCGAILARRPLIEDISANALRAAYRDSRFLPLERGVARSILVGDAAVPAPIDKLS
ncbi:AmmeMemoRadiSam system protein B [Methylocystis sp. IM2]|uniref:AmmeMemoRadiSam system protein B n=1 Tax=Methylocystis sp. IM2 TaxID=3136563 RepID=UPI0030F92738